MGTCLSTDKFNCCLSILEHHKVENIEPFSLKIPLVLQKILGHFSNKELLQLSLVDKQWNCEARSLVAKRGGLIANLNPYSAHMVGMFSWPRHDLAALASYLQSTTNSGPTSICGINVKIGYSKCFPGSNVSNRKLDPSYNVILDQIKWKNLAVTIGPDWQHKTNCQAFQLVKEILKDKCEHLSEIRIKAETNLEEALIQELFKHCRFPQLKRLTIRCWPRSFELSFGRALVSRAPKLEKLYASASILTGNLLEGSSAVIVPLWYFSPFEEFCQSLLNAIRPERLVLRATGEDLKRRDMERFTKIMPVVLQNSWNTLNHVQMELFFALPLMNYGISFVNIRRVTICIPEEFYNTPQPAVMTFAKELDFLRIFPSLREINISHGHSYDISQDDITEFLKPASPGLWEPQDDKTLNIKHLIFEGFAQRDKIKFLAQMLPHIQSLTVQALYGAKIPYGLIWEHWTSLKNLQVDIYIKYIENLDSVFCGIHPEEVAQLRGKKDEYLKAVHIVPIMPAITCMKELRTLDLKLNYVRPNERSLMLSKITHLIAFKRCPHLSVTVRG